MKPIKTEHTNRNFVAPGCFDLPAYNDGQRTVITYEVTPEDLAKMAETGRFYVCLHFGNTIPPIRVGTDDPHLTHKDAMCLIAYESVALKQVADTIIVWNTIDAEAPRVLFTDRGNFRRNINIPNTLCHIKDTKAGDWVLCEHPEDNRRVLVRVDEILADGQAKETIFELKAQR